MAKRTSKAEIILQGARERREVALKDVNRIEAVLELATATLRAHCEAYDALEQQLAPTPRKVKADPKLNVPSAGKRSSRKGAETPGTQSTEGNSGNAGSALLPDNPEEFQHGVTA